MTDAGAGWLADALGVPPAPFVAYPAPEVDPLLRAPRGAASGPGGARSSIRDSLSTRAHGGDGDPFLEAAPPGAADDPTGPAAPGAMLRDLTRAAQRWAPDAAVRRCGLYPVPSRDVELVRTVDRGRGRGHVGAVQRCGRAQCPHCWAGICAVRARELSRGVTWWRAQGGRVWLVTLTIRHRRGDAIERFRGGMFGAWSSMLATREWQAFRRDHALRLDDGSVVRVGYARAFEATAGEHGYHPHFHALVSTSYETTEADVYRAVCEGWRRAVARMLPGHEPTAKGLDVRECDDEMGAAYVAKMGFEVSAALKEATTSKTSRTMMGLLRAANEGDADAGRTWRRFARATKGVRVLEWSRDSPRNPDAWRRLAGVRATTDEQAAERAERDAMRGRVLVARVPRDVWFMAWRSRDAIEGIMRAVSDGSRAGVVEVVRERIGSTAADAVRLASRTVRDATHPAIATRRLRGRVEAMRDSEWKEFLSTRRALKDGRKFERYKRPEAPLRW